MSRLKQKLHTFHGHRTATMPCTAGLAAAMGGNSQSEKGAETGGGIFLVSVLDLHHVINNMFHVIDTILTLSFRIQQQ